MDVIISESKEILEEEVLLLYKANAWSAADKPKELMNALLHSHTLVTARSGGKLVGLGNAISDGYLVVYFPHLLVHPDFQGKGVGKKIMNRMSEVYNGFHMQMLTADKEAVDFYQRMGFEKAGDTQPMWVYQGNEH